MQRPSLFSRILIVLFTIVYSFIIYSCNYRDNKKLKLALKQAGINKKELLNVIGHYKSRTEDSLKLKAAFFLIENMPGSFSYDTSSLSICRPILVTYDSLLKDKQKFTEDELEMSLNSLWNKITSSNDIYNNTYHSISKDINNISSDLLIKNIDDAFEAWKSNPYTNSISFDEFCEYILPYRRMQGTCIEEWRPIFYKRHISLIKNSYPLPIQQVVDSVLWRYSDFQNTFKIIPNYPYIKLSDYYLSKRGTCATKCWMNSMIFASLGIPVTVDYIPAWGNRNGKHYWNSIIYKGQTLPFESYWEKDKWKYKKLYSNTSEDSLLGKFRIPKVFRQSYISDSLSPANNPNESTNNVPPFFLDTKKKDVSKEYFRTQDVEIAINYRNLNVQYAYLCVFNPFNLIPVQWGKIKNNKVVFTDMGMDIVYTPAIYQNGKLFPIDHAFYLNTKGEKIPLNPSNDVQSVSLTRKYPLYPYKKNWVKALIGGKFQGANRIDFKDACDLYRIEKAPNFTMQHININNKSTFRYIRFLFPKGRLGNLAEMKCFSNNKQNKKIEIKGNIISSEIQITKNMHYMFDDDIATYLPPDTLDQSANLSKPYWIGLDLTKSVNINAISFCPRNDTNNIIFENNYELFYWNKEWISLGIKKSVSNTLTYNNVPMNSLLILKCHNGGIEERIFLYKEQKQIWY